MLTVSPSAAAALLAQIGSPGPGPTPAAESSFGEQFISALIPAVLILVFFIVAIKVYRHFIRICRPNQVLIFSGRQFRTLFKGRSLKFPILEEVQTMDRTIMEVQVSIENAYSKGGIPLNVVAIGNVKITEDPDSIYNAVERFLGRDRREIQAVAQQTLEGHLRGVIATLTPEEINEDRLEFGKRLRDEAEADLKKLGLHLDTFNIHHITDNAKYLESVGRQQIAIIIKEAEVAESIAERESAEAEAQALAVAKVAQQQAETIVTTKANEMRKMRAELEAQAKSAEERAQAAKETARATAEQDLQAVRAELEQKRLMADIVLPSEAEAEAKALAARATAAPISEQGKAIAASLELVAKTWNDAGDGAKPIFLIQQLDQVLRAIVDRLAEVRVDNVSLVDRGDGSSLPRYLASFPATVNAVLEELRRATGIDVAGTLAGRDGSSTGTTRGSAAPAGEA